MTEPLSGILTICPINRSKNKENSKERETQRQELSFFRINHAFNVDQRKTYNLTISIGLKRFHIIFGHGQKKEGKKRSRSVKFYVMTLVIKTKQSWRGLQTENMGELYIIMVADVKYVLKPNKNIMHKEIQKRGGGETVSRLSHKQEILGANPSPRTIQLGVCNNTIRSESKLWAGWHNGVVGWIGHKQ